MQLSFKKYMKILLTLRPVIDWISQFMVKQVRVNIKQLPLWVLACSAPVEPGKASKMALKCSKCVSFRGRCPLDPARALKRAPGPPAVRGDSCARYASHIFRPNHVGPLTSLKIWMLWSIFDKWGVILKLRKSLLCIK